jgi:hypothetical protein
MGVYDVTPPAIRPARSYCSTCQHLSHRPGRCETCFEDAGIWAKPSACSAQLEMEAEVAAVTLNMAVCQ